MEISILDLTLKSYKSIERILRITTKAICLLNKYNFS